MKNLALILILIPILCQAQWIEEDYFFASFGVDPKNLVLGSEVNDPAFNGRFTLGYRNQGFQIQSTYETFKAIDYQSIQISAGHAFNTGNQLQFVGLLGIGITERKVNWIPQVYHPSIAIEGNIEYHLNNRIVFKAVLEGKYRGELEKLIGSGYLEIGVKF